MKIKYFAQWLAVFVSTVLLIGSCSVPTKQESTPNEAVDVAAMKKVIQDKNNQFTQAHITGDTAFLNNIFSSDARVFAPNANAITGRRAIATINAEYVNYGISEFREETTALYGSGPYLIDEGTYLMRYGKPNITEKGKYLNVWKQEEGDWKLYANIWNTNALK